MKMKTFFKKRRFLAALTAALLISAALIASCMGQLGEQEDHNVIPEGKGLVKISFAKKIALTVYPTSLPDPDDLFYDISFTSKTGNAAHNHSESKLSFTNAEKAITLAIDDYDVFITAWDDASGTNAIAGWENDPLDPVEVKGSTSTPVDVNLKGWTDTGSKGTFTYSIIVPNLPTGWAITTDPSGYAVRTLTIYNAGGSVVTTDANSVGIGTTGVITLANNAPTPNTGSIALPGGYYTVKIKLQAANCQNREVSTALHIYNTQTSDWTIATIPPLNQDKFSAEFDLNFPGGNASFDPDTAHNTYLQDCSSVNIDGDTNDYSGLDTQGSLNFLSTLQNPGTPASLTYDFKGWFTVAVNPLNTDEWNLGTDRLFEDTNLYAKWTIKPAGPGATFTITFTVTDGNIATPVVANPSGTITYGGLETIGGQSVTLTFADGTGVAYTNIIWYMDGVEITGETNASLLINSSFSQLNRLIVGTHVIFVTGDKGGQTFSASVNIVTTK